MHIVITGGLGFLGQRLAQQLLKAGTLVGQDGQPKEIQRLTITDIVSDTPAWALDPRVRIVPGDIGDLGFVQRLVGPDVDSVFHLGSLVSGGAEQDFEGGLRANFLGTWHVLEACRVAGRCPRLVFTSSVAAFGGEMPDLVGDDQRLTPENSYGTHKAVGELLIADYSRKGYLDGRSVRLPIIAVRPGRANTAASSWASSLVREPLEGRDYDCPVAPEDVGLLLSPNQAIRGLILAHDSPADVWGVDRAVMMAGLRASALELWEALRRQAGEAVAQRVQWKADPFIRNIVNRWPSHFTLDKAHRIGFRADESLDAIVQAFQQESQGQAA